MVKRDELPAKLFESILDADQKTSLLNKLGLDNLPQDRKVEVLEMMVDTILYKVFTRISPVLTEEDIICLDKLGKDENSSRLIKEFLLTRVPNLATIISEEIESYNKEAKSTTL